MSLLPGALIVVTAERPVAGGRMLARHEGQIVLVAGAIPDERVRVRIERANRQMVWATTVDVLEPSADRRAPICDALCGGSSYAHVQYGRQPQLKSMVIADAFRRVGKLTLERPPRVTPSPECGYRVRARLHVRGGRAGFFREGSHALCDAAATGQLHADLPGAADAAITAMGDRSRDCESVVVAENVPATERVVHLEARAGTHLDDVRGMEELPGVTGVTTTADTRLVTLAGVATVTDTADQLFGGHSPIGTVAAWRRHAMSFFQANRFLIGALVNRVLEASDRETCVDLYSGVGLFAVALAARGRRVIAVEGDPVSGRDLASNAGPWRERLEVVHTSVEDYLARRRDGSTEVVILDPPRTGVSAQALDALVAWAPHRLVYVSCDPATLARDAARIIAGGYTLASIEAFDLFPNTPHVEMLAVFDSPLRPR